MNYDEIVDVDPEALGGDPGEEPEPRLPARTPPAPKKPLDVFLAEFERRLAEHPGEPATDAHLDLEARAEGARKRPLGSPRAGAPAPPRLDPDQDSAGERQPRVDPGTNPMPRETPTADAAPAAEAAPAGEPAAGPERRRQRGRRHRRRRH